MKKIILASTLVFFASLSSALAADTQWDPTLHQAQSCAELETAVNEYLQSRWYGGQFGPVARGGVMMNDAPTKAALESSADGMGGGGGDFSSTNVQKEGVDEPELIKSNGTYLYYLDQQKGILRVLDPKTQKEVTSLVLPKDYWNAQLLINGSQLILVGSKSLPYSEARYNSSFIYRDQQALVAVYSISQATPKLIQAYTFDGWLQDSRVVDNQLVLITSQSLSWAPVYKAVNDMIYQNKSKSIDVAQFKISAQDILPKWSTLVSVPLKTANGKVKMITRKKTSVSDCAQFLYKKADWMKGEGRFMYGGESLTTIVRLPLNTTNAKPQIKTVMGNNAQIHVSKKLLYLTSPTYMRQPFICPADAMCMPWRGQGQYTTIYGFDLDGIKYKYATVVDGNTWNQYSMDETTSGKFRIVTSARRDDKNTSNVYIVDAAGKVEGKLENIAPGEQFYGVRFIGDYLYLVTYRQVDPLFVIDTSNPAKPTIAGELKMPGYSTYLHPYGPLKDGVQYLIGLGYDTKTTPEGREQQMGVKLDLYKVDFTKKDSKGKVTVTQAWTKTLGQAGSQTEALQNPRMFVFNNATKELTLPIVLAETKKVQSCNVVYDINGKEIRKDCYPYDQALTTFAGVKSWVLGLDTPTETISVDYKEKIKNPYPTDGGVVMPMQGDAVSNTVATFVDPRWFTALQSRVGYIGSQFYFVGNQFSHFFTKADQKGVFVEYK